MELHRILALDPARLFGWAYGIANGNSVGPLEYGVRKLAAPGQAEDAAANLGPFLRDLIRQFQPTHIVAEMYMNPAAQKNAAAGVGQLLIHGAIYATANCFGLATHRPNVSTARKFVCGRASAGEKWMSADQKRKATKRMVIDRLHMIGAMDRECEDDNVADAVCLWVYWAQRHGRATPAELQLFKY